MKVRETAWRESVNFTLRYSRHALNAFNSNDLWHSEIGLREIAVHAVVSPLFIVL